MDVFAKDHPDPVPFSYGSIEPSYDVYGWNVAMNRGVVEFSGFDDVSPSGFRLAGSGSATVTSPAIYDAGRSYDVTIAGEPTRIVAGEDGRLTVDVPLGPENLTQQYFTPSGRVFVTHVGGEPQSPTTTVHTTEVEVAATEDPRDTTPPTITIDAPSDGEVFVLGEDASASFSCTDDDAGVASCDGSDIDTSRVGDHVFTINASDKAGNTASKTHTYHVVYDTEAFAVPIASPPAMNDSNGNRTIPVKWSLRDADGASYASLGSDDVGFAWMPIDCTSREPVGAPTTASGGGPTYEAQDERYTFTSRAPAGSSGSCRRFTMTLDDGTQHSADFALR